MFSFITGLNPRLYLGIGLVLVALYGVVYVNGLKSDIEDRDLQLENKNVKLEKTQSKLDEANKNNELIIQAYEQTLAIEKEIAAKKAITQEQKQEVIKTTSKLKEAVIKRGEIKQDEKSNFSIVTF